MKSIGKSKTLGVVAIALIWLCTMTLWSQTTFYVKHDAAGNADGTSWTDAFPSLQSALDAASSGSSIWVASGTYQPESEVGGTGIVYKTFQMKNGVEIYGGFAGNEGTSFNLDDRDFETNETVLSGDLGSDVYVYHVFRHVDLGLDNTAILDGFTIAYGKADGSDPDDKGGGMLNSVSSASNGSSPTLRNCIFSSNSATEGGGMYNSQYSSPAVSHTIFSSNTASAKGGAVFNLRNSPAFSSCSFISNEVTGTNAGDGGGAIYNSTSNATEGPSVIECSFTDNRVATTGTGTSGGGAIFSYLNPGKIIITNSNFTGNVAKYGGAVYHNSGSDAHRDNSNISITGSYFEENEAEYGGGIFSDRHNTIVISSYIRGNQASEQAGGFYSRYASSQIINSLVSGNKSANHGGGLYFNDDDPEIINTTISGNFSSERGGGISIIGGSVLSFKNSILYNNLSPVGNELWICSTCIANVSYSLFGNASGDVHIEAGGALNADNSLTQDPVFLNPLTPTLSNTPNIQGNYFICGCTSPCIDAGNNSYVPAGLAEDLRGITRIIDGNGDDTDTVDLGAYEYSPDGCNALAPYAGDGSSFNPYEISIIQQLYWIAVESSRWDKHYIQTADIDACNTATWYGGAGWSPIGNSSIKFTGTYDGQGYSISDLTINRPSANEIGLFGEVDGQSTARVVIQNLTLLNASIKGYDQVGALVGITEQFNDIVNCHSEGSVEGRRNVGGLVGWGRRTDFTKCSSSSNVSVNNLEGALYHGGLIGHVNTTTTVKECFATGNVSGRSRVGGLIGAVGWNSYIEDSYATGNVTSSGMTNPMIGGLVGEVWNGGIRRSYAKGIVDISGLVSDYGGLVGNKTDDSNYFDVGNYWDTETSDLSTSAMGTGKTTQEMTTDALIVDYTSNIYLGAGWDFKGEFVNGGDGIWNIGNDKNNDYPYLSWQYPDDPATLPVELSSFTAIVTADMAVMLEWTAETETNMLGYNIYRSESISLTDAVKANFVIIPAHNTSVALDYSYVDEDVEADRLYYYWLQSNDLDLTHEFHGPISVLVEPQGEPGAILIPEIVTDLVGAYPNPFNPATAIRFSLDTPAKVSIDVYNVLGQHIKTLISDEPFTKGLHSVVWDGKDSNGRGSASGVYFYRMQTDDGFQMTKRMAIIK